MYQTKGLLNEIGEPQVDYSYKAHDNVNQSDLPAGLEIRWPTGLVGTFRSPESTKCCKS